MYINRIIKSKNLLVATCASLVMLTVSFPAGASEAQNRDEQNILTRSQNNTRSMEHVFEKISSNRVLKNAPMAAESRMSEQDKFSKIPTSQIHFEAPKEPNNLSARMSLSHELVISDSNLFVPSALRGTHVTFSNGEFYVKNSNSSIKVERYNLSPELRGIQEDQLQAYLGGGYLSIRKIEDEYALTAKTRLRGGGPIAGAIAYWVTKSVCYGTAVAGAGAAVVATGGAAGAVMGGAAAAATLGAGAGATVVGGAIAGAGLTAGAATTTAAVVASAGGVAGAIAAVESASLGAGCFFTLIPFLP